MPRTKKVVQAVEPVNAPLNESAAVATPLAYTKDDYIKARETIRQYREAQKSKPKRKCSEKQLEALKAGREKNNRFKNQVKPLD